MSLFKNQWDSENYPSYQDYLEAKKNGTLKVQRNYIDPSLSAEPDQSRYNSEQQAHRHSTKDSGKTSTQKKVQPYGQPKPFTQGTLKEKPQKSKLKGIIFLLVFLFGLLPSAIEFLGNVTGFEDIESFFDNIQVEESSTNDSSVTETAAASSFISIVNEADHYILLQGDKASTEPISMDGLIPGAITTFESYQSDEGAPYLDLTVNGQTFALLDLSLFLQDPDASRVIDDQGSLVEGSRIESVFTDMNRDGRSDLLLYYYNGVDYPYVEVLYNTGNASEPFTVVDYFESYEHINITAEGNIQRIDGEGKLYDEIKVYPDSLNVLESTAQ